MSQSSLDGLLCDISSMLESQVNSLETQVLNTLGDANPEVKVKIREIFHSKGVANLFDGLNTEHLQKKFYKEKFHLVVRGMYVPK